ncbi:MAG: 3,4-dihydroxyphenylacetate 2,3-dioxygenase [Candidatus Dormibacteraeota bacterium]|nr:3,4-dihydroxyphenylacetate 2,3-dioxygenase [Candidatus Dormibacteraeota bacterium]
MAGGRVVAPFDIIRAAHAELVVADPGRSREFYVDRLGFVVTEETPDALYLRGYEDRHHHCLVVRRGPRPLVDHLSFLVASEEDLDRAAAFYAGLGCPTRRLRPDEERGQGRALRVRDPLGFPVEYYATMERAERLTQRYELHHGGRIQRLDHLNLHVPDVQAAFDHYFGDLGFRCSEYIEGDPPGDTTLYAAWLFRKPTVHDVALTAGAGPRLHHVAFWTADSHAVTELCDQLGGAGAHHVIERGPGRHGVSNAFYLYLRDPDGHRIELYTADYWTGDPDLVPIRWSVNDDQRRSFWGHPVPERWYRESSLVADLDGSPVAVAEPPVRERSVEILPS